MAETSMNASDILDFAPDAVLSRYFDVLGFALVAPIPVLLDLSGNREWIALCLFVLVLVAFSWLSDRWRLGPDHRSIRRAHDAFIRSFGDLPFFVGFGFVIVAMIILDMQYPKLGYSPSTLVFAGIACGEACRALWVSYKLKLRPFAHLDR